MNIKIKCPYCNFENQMNLGLDYYTKKKVVACNPEEGGCDRDFVIAYCAKIEATTHKIEGEQ